MERRLAGGLSRWVRYRLAGSPQGLKPASLLALGGPAEAVPVPKQETDGPL